MTTPTLYQRETPIISMPENDPHDPFAVTVEVMKVDGRPLMRVIDKTNGEELIIPERIFKAIARESRSSFSRARIDLGLEQCKFANIENTFPELNLSKRLSTDYSPSYCLQDSSNEVIEGTPILKFIHD